MIFGTNIKKKITRLVETRESEHHNWTLHIQISLSTSFQLKLTILSFWNAFTQKANFHSKEKIAFLRVSMVVTYYIKLFPTGADIHNGILMSLLLLVAESRRDSKLHLYCLTLNINLIFVMFNCNSFYRTDVSKSHYWCFIYKNNLKESKNFFHITLIIP